MAGRGKKKSQDNFEKMKREMLIKKQKVKTQHNLETSQEDKSDSITEKVREEDIVKKVQRDKKGNITDTNKIEMVVFQVGEEEFALRISNIKEIIRVPLMTKILGAPQYIIGLCGLRGDLLPVIDSRKLFGMSDKEYNDSSRIIVTDIHGKKVGVVADKVSEVIDVEETAIKEPPGSIKGIDGGVIKGILILNNGLRVVMILDTEKIIKVGNLDAFATQQNTSAGILKDLEAKEDEEEQIIIFNIGIEEYAFNIKYVKEIIRLPNIMKVPNTASHIEGVFSVRNQILAIINLGRLLDINCKQPDEYSRVVILNNDSFAFGVIVDKVSHVIRVQKNLFKESSQIANCNSTEYVKGIFTLNNGKRLVMMLEPHKLICLEEAKGILDVDYKNTVNDKSLYVGEADNNLEHIVVFKLGEEEYGIEINNVQEINRMSGITHFPGAPVFITGMVNLRGDIIPILNLRKLFTIHASDSYNASKFLVVEFGNKRIGIMIDSASEVLMISKVYLEEAPEVFKENDNDNYIDKIAKLNDGKRIVIILNLSTVLSFM